MRNMKYIAAVFFIPGVLSAQSIDINKMPIPGATPTVNIAQPKTFQLKNGLTVLVVENSKLPRVNISLSIDRPPIYEGEVAGVGDIMADQLAALDKDEFYKKVDYLGASLSFAQRGARANMLSKYFPQVFRLMADAIVKPKFSAGEIEKSKERQIESLKSAEKSADAVAERISSALIYGKNSARGEFETEESLRKIQLKDVRDFYQKYYAPNNAYLAIVGDIKYDEVKKLVKKSLKKWKKSKTIIPTLEFAKNVATTEINVVDVPNAVQSVIQVGNVSTLQMKDPQYFAGTIADYILGGGGEARLFMNLREKNGYTYGAYSSLSTNKYSPYFYATANVRNEVTDRAVQEFMSELKGITNIKPEELSNAKEKLKGNFIMSLEKPETIAQYALNQRIQNLPAGFYENYLKSIDNVTIKDVISAAKANILPNRTRIFIAGKVSEIADKVERLGYAVKYFDKEANPIAKPETKRLDTSITLESIAQKYIDAIGGKANVEKINSLKFAMVGKVQGMELETINILAKGGKSSVEIKMMGNTMNKVVYDGREGYVSAQGQKVPLSAELKSELEASSNEIFPELAFGKDTKYKLKGAENINGEETYAVSAGNRTYYYNMTSGLKVAEYATQKAQGETVVVPTYYSDYREILGIKLPFKITSNMGGMDISFDVKSYEINKAKDTDFK